MTIAIGITIETAAMITTIAIIETGIRMTVATMTAEETTIAVTSALSF
ncbi:hypothetical protein ACN1C3_09350 [Pseudomonas sp. H11T01]